MFFIVGAANVFGTLGYSLLPESITVKCKPARTKEPVTALSDKTKDSGSSAWAVYRELLRDPDRQGLMAMSFGTFCSYAAMLTVFPLHAAEVLGDASSTLAISALFDASAVIGLAGASLGGYLANTVGRKQAVVPAAGLICAGALLTATISPDTATMPTLFPPVLVWVWAIPWSVPAWPPLPLTLPGTSARGCRPWR